MPVARRYPKYPIHYKPSHNGGQQAIQRLSIKEIMHGCVSMGTLFRGRGSRSEPIPVLPAIPQDPPETKGFSFKTLGKADVEECVEAVVKTMPQVKWNKEGLKRRLLASNSLTVISRLKGSLAGLINGTVMTPSLPPSIGFMAIFDPESSVKGLGGYLIDEFVKQVQKRDPKTPCIDVSLSNLDTSSMALYSLKGFIVNGFIKNQIRSRLGKGTYDLVHLRRWLAKTPPRSVV